MNTEPPKLVSHLKFRSINPGWTPSPAHGVMPAAQPNLALEAAAGGQPAIKADPRFGSCMTVSTEMEALALVPPASEFKAAGPVSISLWVKGFDFKEVLSLLKQIDGSGSLRAVGLVLPSDSDLAPAAPPRGAPVQPDASWNHWTLTVAPPASFSLYCNGIPCVIPPEVSNRLGPALASISEPPAPRAGSPLVPLAAGQPKTGSIANLRFYEGTLSPAEIRRDMTADETALASFRRSFPIDFALRNQDEQCILEIPDDVRKVQTIDISIENTSTLDLKLSAPSPSESGASETNYHFAVRFRPGTVAKSVIDAAKKGEWPIKLDLNAQKWDGSLARDADGMDVLYLLSQKELTLKPADLVKLPLRGLYADGAGGARCTNVDLRWDSKKKNITLGNNVSGIVGYRTCHMHILNRSGKPSIPLHVGFVGPGVVLNEGEIANTLQLQITNIDTAAKITLNREEPGTPGSKLRFTFDLQGKNQIRPWALAQKGEFIGVEIGDPSGAWKDKLMPAIPDDQGQTDVWTLMPSKTVVLDPGDHIGLTIKGIKSSLPSGLASMKLRYENIPGYWDGAFEVPITKSPVVTRAGSQNVGIGTVPRQAKLTVSAGGDNGNEPTHLQLLRDTTGQAGGSIVFLELRQDDADPPNVEMVYPIIRFMHKNRFGHRIEARPDGFHFLAGDLLGGYDLQVIYPQIASLSQIPGKGTNLIIVAYYQFGFYFRVFGSDGKSFSDVWSETLPAKKREIDDLRAYLKAREERLPAGLTLGEKSQVITLVKSIVSYRFTDESDIHAKAGYFSDKVVVGDTDVMKRISELEQQVKDLQRRQSVRGRTIKAEQGDQRKEVTQDRLLKLLFPTSNVDLSRPENKLYSFTFAVDPQTVAVSVWASEGFFGDAYPLTYAVALDRQNKQCRVVYRPFFDRNIDINFHVIEVIDPPPPG